MPVGDRHDPRDIGMAVWLLELGVPTRRIEEHLKGRIDHTTVCRLKRTIPTSPTKEIALEEEEAETRDLHREIGSYSPALSSSFGSGLGCGTPLAVINRAVKDSNQESDFRGFQKEKFNLINLLACKDQDPVLNRFRRLLVQRVKLLGFDSSSDNDLEFGMLNDMGSLGLAVIRTANERNIKLNLSKLVDGVIIYRKPQSRTRLEEVRRRLICSRCRRLRSFIQNDDRVVCVACGLETPVQKARFRVTKRKLDPEYIDLVHEIVTRKMPGAPSQAAESRV